VMPRAALLDPQGQAVEHALHALGFGEVARVRVGKHVLLDVEAATRDEAAARARSGGGPTLIEALTDRRRGHWAGHIVSDADRPRAVRPSDPIELLRVRLLEHGLVTEAEILDIHERVAGEVTDAVERAQAAVDAGDAELGMDDVFA